MSNETNFYCDKTLDDLKLYHRTVSAIEIFEGTCITFGSIFMLLTVLQLIIFDRLKKFYTIIQSQVCSDIHCTVDVIYTQYFRFFRKKLSIS